MKDNTFDLLLLAGSTLAVGGIMAFANHFDKKDRQRRFDIDRAINTRFGVQYAKSLKPNQIDECMDDLQEFDAEFLDLVTDLGFVVTHIFSESSRSSKPFTVIGISSEYMPPYLKCGYDGELDICEDYKDLLDTNMVKSAVDRVLGGRDYVYDGVHYKDDPDKCLSKIYKDMCKYHTVFLTNVRGSRKSSTGCMGIELDSGNMITWNRAVSNDTSVLTEIFCEFAVDQYIYDKDLFRIVSILLKMDAATMLDMNLNKQ